MIIDYLSLSIWWNLSFTLFQFGTNPIDGKCKVLSSFKYNFALIMKYNLFYILSKVQLRLLVEYIEPGWEEINDVGRFKFDCISVTSMFAMIVKGKAGNNL